MHFYLYKSIMQYLLVLFAKPSHVPTILKYDIIFKHTSFTHITPYIDKKNIENIKTKKTASIRWHNFEVLLITWHFICTKKGHKTCALYVTSCHCYLNLTYIKCHHENRWTKKKYTYRENEIKIFYFFFCKKIKNVRDDSMAGKINEVWHCIWHDDRVVWSFLCI